MNLLVRTSIHIHTNIIGRKLSKANGAERIALRWFREIYITCQRFLNSTLIVACVRSCSFADDACHMHLVCTVFGSNLWFVYPATSTYIKSIICNGNNCDFHLKRFSQPNHPHNLCGYFGHTHQCVCEWVSECCSITYHNICIKINCDIILKAKVNAPAHTQSYKQI